METEGLGCMDLWTWEGLEVKGYGGIEVWKCETMEI
jgi:hypothetical protein